MGPYLAQPNKEKTRYKAENGKLKLRFSRCEMQGNSPVIQAGDALCKTPPFPNSKSETVTPSSVSSMAMAVSLFPYLGLEVSKYVERIFVTQLKSCKLYKEEKYS